MTMFTLNFDDGTMWLKDPERTRVENMTPEEKRQWRLEQRKRADDSVRQLYRGVFVHMHKWNTKGKRGSGRRKNQRHAQQWTAYPRYRGPAARRRRNRAKKEG